MSIILSSLSMSAFRLSLLAMLVVATPAFAVFNDVPSSHPNREAIDYVLEEGFVQGYDDGLFRPGQTINRAEFTKIVTLYRFGQKMVDMCGSRMQFRDLQSDAWYVKYICRAKDAHMIEGYPDGTFRPDRTINFAEAAKIIASASSFNSSDSQLPTVAADAPWYEQYVRFLADRNAIPATIISLEQHLTRGEMAEMIYRLHAGVITKSSRTYEEMSGLASQEPVMWKAYGNISQGLTFQYPSSYRITTESIIQEYPSGQDWFRLQLDSDAASQVHLLVEVNPDGYGPFFPDILLTVEENANGSLRIVRTEKEETFDGVRLLMVKPYPASNGNTYSFRFSHKGDINLEADFYDILNSVRLEKGNGTQVYDNMERGWSVEYPSDWNVREDAELPTVDDFVSVDGRWTLFEAPGNTEAHVFVAFPNVCPDLSGNFLATAVPWTINGKTFTRARGSEGAAGSIGEYAVYTYKQPSSPCVVMVTYFFHSTGDANDEPERSRIKQANLEMQQAIEQMVQSYRDL